MKLLDGRGRKVSFNRGIGSLSSQGSLRIVTPMVFRGFSVNSQITVTKDLHETFLPRAAYARAGLSDWLCPSSVRPSVVCHKKN